MQVAVLVLANDKPLIFGKVCRHYLALGWSVFVHLDAKRDLSAYQNAAGLAHEPRVQWLHGDQRHSIFWGGYTMIEATLSLIRATQWQHERYMLVSDDCIPVRDGQTLRKEVERNVDRISTRRIQPTEIFNRRYAQFYFLDSNATSLKGREIELSCFDDAVLDKVNRLRQLRASGKAVVDLRYGSQWWLLTRASLTAIVAYIERDTQFRESFEFSAVPDEIMLQTAYVMAMRHEPNLPSPMAVDWQRAPRPYVFNDWNSIAAYCATLTPAQLFLRKLPNNPALAERWHTEFGAHHA